MGVSAFIQALRENPALVAERVRWLFLETYGEDWARRARQALLNPDALLQVLEMVAIAEWYVDARSARECYWMMDPENRLALMEQIDAAVKGISADGYA